MNTDNLTDDDLVTRLIGATKLPEQFPAEVLAYRAEILSRLATLRAECRDRESAYVAALSHGADAEERTARYEDLCVRLAKHLRNTDELNAVAWGVTSMELLAELRGLIPQRYDAEVRPASPAGG